MPTTIIAAKKYGFSNTEIMKITGKSLEEIEAVAGLPSYKMVDTCAAEFPAQTPYSTPRRNRLRDRSQRPAEVLILGSGPIRIGQGIEFDYCTSTQSRRCGMKGSRSTLSTTTRRPSPRISTPRTGLFLNRCNSRMCPIFSGRTIITA